MCLPCCTLFPQGANSLSNTVHDHPGLRQASGGGAQVQGTAVGLKFECP